MYYNGQVVYDLDTRKPVRVGKPMNGSAFAWDNVPKNTTHFLEVNPKHEVLPEVPKFADGLPQFLTINGRTYRYTDYHREQTYTIALPATIKQATEWLKSGRIFPAPKPQR